MNRFRLEVKPKGQTTEAVFFIDDRPLLDIIKEAERAFNPKIAGTYIGPPGEIVLAPSRHLLGEPGNPHAGGSSQWPGLDPASPGSDEWGDTGTGKVTIAGCNCGVVGCWPLLVRIEVGYDTITWKDFENPFRSVGEEPWNWERVGPFTFNRAAYERELRPRNQQPTA